MIMIYKIEHKRNFDEELRKAKQVVEFAIKNRFNTSSALVKHIGLSSIIACQLLRRYGRSREVGKTNFIKLIIPGQAIKYDKEKRIIRVPCIKIEKLKYSFSNDFEKISQMEVGKTFYYISVKYANNPEQIIKHCRAITKKEKIKKEKKKVILARISEPIYNAITNIAIVTKSSKDGVVENLIEYAIKTNKLSQEIEAENLRLREEMANIKKKQPI